jgi:hypothetical protein
MRKTITSLIFLAAPTEGVCHAHAEHITPEELAFNSLQSQSNPVPHRSRCQRRS